MSYKLLKANLILLIGYSISLVTFSLYQLVFLFYRYRVDAIQEAFSVIVKTVPFVIVSLIYTSIFWIPTLLVLWVMDGLLLIEFRLNPALAMIIEWLVLCIPLVILCIDNYTSQGVERWIAYPFLALTLAVSQLYKVKYLKYIKEI